MKTCNTCGQDKPLHEFHVHRQSKDGRQAKCIECNNANAREQYSREKQAHPMVYSLRCVKTNEEYIGSTTTGIGKRLRGHFTSAWGSKARKKRSSRLYKCMRVWDAKEHWEIRPLGIYPNADTEALRTAEQAFIDARNPRLNQHNAVRCAT